MASNLEKKSKDFFSEEKLRREQLNAMKKISVNSDVLTLTNVAKNLGISGFASKKKGDLIDANNSVH